MLNEANALNENDLLSLECRLQKSQSPVYVVHRARGRQDRGVGFGGYRRLHLAGKPGRSWALCLGTLKHGTLNWDMLTVTALTTGRKENKEEAESRWS